MGKKTNSFILLILLAPFTLSVQAKGEEAPSRFTNKRIDTLEQKVQILENDLSTLEAELEILKIQSKTIVNRTFISYLNAFYGKFGASLILPRGQSFPFRTDTGLGATVGIGKYIGSNHVFDLSCEWDLYSSLALRYRYETHPSDSGLALAPVIGVKTKVLNLRPFDNFIEQPSELKDVFLIYGLAIGVPVGRSLLMGQLELWSNQQSFIVFQLNTQFHF